MIPFSVLDLSPITQGSTAADAFRNSRDLAQHAERWGYLRYWLAEHHNMPGIASAATSVVIGHVAAGTKTIRVGSGGIMLPNHSPLVIAEQFGTLESLFPGRIDLGLGRAPGTDMLTARALRRNMEESADRFPQDVMELIRYLEPAQPGQRIRAVPGAGLRVPVWLLGSSLFSAEFAAMIGVPFAFASHFAPEMLMDALHIYRSRFEPSAFLDKPYAMVGMSLFAADAEEEGRRIFTSAQQQFVNLRRGTPGPLPPPVDDIADHASPMELANVSRALACAFVGTADSIAPRLRAFIEQTQADEVMISGQIFEHAARLRSFEIGALIRDRLAAEMKAA